MVTLSNQVRDSLANQLKVESDQVQKALNLLGSGSSAAFVARYRRAETGGLNVTQVGSIVRALARAEELELRRAAILKSVDGHDGLTEEIKSRITAASSLQELEDLYLPFKRKKPPKIAVTAQAELAKLAGQIQDSTLAPADLDAALDKLIDPESILTDRDAVLAMACDIIAERMSYSVDARKLVRDSLRTASKLVCKEFVEPAGEESDQEKDLGVTATKETANSETTEAEPTDKPTEEASKPVAEAKSDGESKPDGATADHAETPATQTSTDSDAEKTDPVAAKETTATADASETEPAEAETATDAAPKGDVVAAPAKTESKETKKKGKGKKSSPANTAELRRQQRRESRQRKREHLRASFKSLFSFSESLNQITPPKVLAINRGERVRVLDVALKADTDALLAKCKPMLVPEEHAHKELLEECAKRSFSNYLMPGVERDLRRELTDRAERYAVKVFSRNMRELLLQPPTPKRVLAIDPGLRYGCKAVALDERGQLLGETTVHALGDAERVAEGRRRMAELINKHNLELIAIGNGTGVRQAETTVATMIAESFAEKPISYTLVNESGTSVYSTGALANEELPEADPRTRAAVSIGRRLIDPISEMVKVEADQIGSGAYQQDVKLKHLQPPLVENIRVCVNEVGVDINTASPSLLRFVSGLDEHTATSIAEHRLKKQPYATLEQVKEVADISDAIWEQAVGFLRIYDGDEPLDSTPIHPVDYAAAERLLKAAGLSKAELAAEIKRQRQVILTPQPSSIPPAPSAPPVAAEKKSEPTAKEEKAEATPTTEVAEKESAETKDATPKDEAPKETATSDTTTAAETPATNAQQTDTEKLAAQPTAKTPATEKPAAAPAEEPTKPAVVEKSAWEIKVAQLSVEDTATRISCTPEVTRQLIADLKQPGRDCRFERSAPIMRRSSLRWEDLQPDLEIVATVLSVVDFGAFVDLGIRESGLVHISELGNRYISDPHEVVSVGDSLRLWVAKVDQEKRRVSLTALSPEERQNRKESGENRRRGGRGGSGGGNGERPANGRKRRERGSGGGGGGKSRGGRNYKSDRPTAPRTFEAKPRRRKPKAPAVPLTDAMKKGKEPMRTFGDLAQFFTDDKSKSDDKKKKKDSEKKDAKK